MRIAGPLRRLQEWLGKPLRRIEQRHGDHIGQEGTPEGGSQPGYTHVEGSLPGEATAELETVSDEYEREPGDWAMYDPGGYDSEEYVVELLSYDPEDEAWEIEFVSGPQRGDREKFVSPNELDDPDLDDIDTWTSKDPDSLEARAISVFGETEDHHEAGFILVGGEMLDFSGKREGGPAGTRSLDHRDIGRAYLDDEGPEEGGSETLIHFMRETGAIRLSYYGRDLNFDISTKPSESQWRKIAQMAEYSESVYADISDPDTGSRIWSSSAQGAMLVGQTLREIRQQAAMLLERSMVIRIVVGPLRRVIEKHGKHVGQEGREEEDERGGSKPGYTHEGAEAEAEPGAEGKLEGDSLKEALLALAEENEEAEKGEPIVVYTDFAGVNTIRIEAEFDQLEEEKAGAWLKAKLKELGSEADIDTTQYGDGSSAAVAHVELEESGYADYAGRWEAADKWLEESFGEASSKLLRNQISVLSSYKGNDYYGLNAMLRGEDLDARGFGEDEEYLTDMLGVIDSVMEGSEVPEPITVYRGMDLEDQFSRNFDQMKGEVFEFDGFTSTSLDTLAAEAFTELSESEGEEPVMLEIRVPAGVNGIWLDFPGMKAAEPGVANEREILLDRGMRFRVLETRTEGAVGGEEGLAWMVVEVVGND